MRFRDMFFIAILFLVIEGQLINAQEFVPLQLGNVWVWRNEFGSIVKSTLTDTNYFINDHYYCNISYGTSSTPGNLIRFQAEDSMYVRYIPSAPPNYNEIPFYKYNAALGDTWSYPLGGGSHRVRSQIYDVQSGNIFGKQVMIKYLLVDDAGLGGAYESWTDEFGKITQIEMEGQAVVYSLHACVINGVVYGDTSTGIIDNHYLNYCFNLYQNYPNPFNPSTIIEFEIKESSHVELKVYDILGKIVADLINENKHPGRYKLKFIADRLPSGIYFYKLTAGGKTQIKKMILLR